MEQGFGELLVLAYQGEVLGEELFGRLAERQDDEDHRRKLLAVQRMEARTKERVRSLLDEIDLDVDRGDDSTSRAAGAQAADALGTRSWSELMAAIGPATRSYRDAYARLRSLAPDHDHPVLVALTAHEEALRAFADAELAGRPDDSLAPLLDVIGALGDG